jgi:Ca-activated chloride channel family protein
VLLAVAIAVVVALFVLGLTTLGGGGGNPAGATPAPLPTCAKADEQLRIASSQDKYWLLRDIAHDYGAHQAGGHCVEVVVDSKNSGIGKDALVRGWSENDGQRPDVYAPASTAWLTLLRQELGDKAGTVFADRPAEPVATAPLTIAMPKPMAEVLGWPEADIGWEDLRRLATDPRGWAAYGHPEFGQFKLGKTNPNLSTSGLNATVGAYFAATGTASELTEQAIDDPRNQASVHEIERSIVHYGDTTLTFLTNLLRADDQGAATDYISAVTVEENSVLDYNEGNPTGNPGTRWQHKKPEAPLVAIYPKEGTLVSDHPYALLSWADEARRTASDDFLRHLHSDAVQHMFQDHGYRDYQGHPGPHATMENGVLPERKFTDLGSPSAAVLTKIQRTWSTVLRKRANVLLVLDVSDSMKTVVPGAGKTRLQLAQEAAADALPQLVGDDRVGLWMFSQGLDGPLDYRELDPIGPLDEAIPRGVRKDVLLSDIVNLHTYSATGLYDTTLAAFDTVATSSDPTAINAVLLLTDGKNEDAISIDLKVLLDRLRARTGSAATPVRVFTLAYGDKAEKDVLRQIAETTNAATYDASDPRTIREVLIAVISNF